MKWHPRRRLLVDAHVQGSLIRRVVIYWLACVVTVELLKLCWRIATGPEQPTFIDYFLHQDLWTIGGQLAVSALLLVPIVIDILKVSNRFAGPVFRMRRTLQKVANEGIVEPVKLRDGDYWHDFADDLNAALERLSARSNQIAKEDISAARPVAASPTAPLTGSGIVLDLEDPLSSLGRSLTSLGRRP